MSRFPKSFFFAVFLVLTTLLHTSCEYESDGENFHEVEVLPDEIGVAINLADVSPDDIIYVYGPTYLYYQILPEKGKVQSVSFTYDGETVKDDEVSGYFRIDPHMSNDNLIKELDVDILVKANNGSLADVVGGFTYEASMTYNVKYVRITASDFAVKKQEIDKVTIEMVNKNENPCQYVIDGELVTDLDNIEYHPADFPFGNYLVKIYLLPTTASVDDYESYNHIEFRFYDKTLPGMGTSPPPAVDISRQELYTEYDGEVFVYDRNFNLLERKRMDAHYITVTPSTGLVSCYAYSKVVTYSDKSFSTVVSTINNAFSGYSVNSRDQLFWVNNFQVDAFDLRTGQLIYSINFPDGVWGLAASADGKYLFVQTSEERNVYELTDTGATLLYSIDMIYDRYLFHPVNKSHLILQSRFEGFIIYDVETRRTVFSSEGEFQNVDYVTGTFLYYDKDYSSNYLNRFVDKSYNEVYVLKNNTRGLYGSFELFNNYLFKSTAYIDISSKLSNQ